MKNIPMIIDGPNYINRVIELGIDPIHISRQLSLEGLREVVNAKLKQYESLSGTSESVELICSKKRFGPQKSKFSGDEQSLLIDRFRAEIGVYVDVVEIPGSSEKGIDMTVSGKMEDYAKDADAMVLVSADRDFIPVLRKLRHKVKILLIALHEGYPIELQNEGYATIFLHEDYRGLFKYHYPRFHINDLTQQNCAELFSEADDRVHNQVRVTNDGYIHISKTVGAVDLFGTKFQWETYVAYNGYVGPKAGSDSKYIKHQLKQVKIAWERGVKGFIDYSFT